MRISKIVIALLLLFSTISISIGEEEKENPSPTSIHFANKYTSKGVDEVLPEYFHENSMIIEMLSLKHNPSGLTFTASNFLPGDTGRTVVSVGIKRKFSRIHGSIQHRWIHVKNKENFFHSDRHRTSISSGITVGHVTPYLLLSSDLPAYIPADEGTVYGGAGATLHIPIDQIRTGVEVEASLVGSIFQYSRKHRALYRGSIGLTKKLGKYGTLQPKVNILKDAFSDEYVSWVSITLVGGTVWYTLVR